VGGTSVGISFVGAGAETNGGHAFFLKDAEGCSVICPVVSNTTQAAKDALHLEGSRWFTLISGQLFNATGYGVNVIASATPVTPIAITLISPRIVGNALGEVNDPTNAVMQVPTTSGATLLVPATVSLTTLVARSGNTVTVNAALSTNTITPSSGAVVRLFGTDTGIVSGRDGDPTSGANDTYWTLRHGPSNTTAKHLRLSGVANALFIRNAGDADTLFRINENKDVISSSDSLAINASSGFFYIPAFSGPGTPTGSPNNYVGSTPLVWDGTRSVVYGRDFANALWRALPSVRTLASVDSTNVTDGAFAFSIHASGASFALRSNNTIWYFTSSQSTKA